ncbi:heterokaryon incompatibility protein [Colletotrichum tamarilloi]|uniref:Heterokaryon incompatibility protein n=1 Tax=Colletotrichum tamarilloi TaxID=1209934 RepID=A0ABQ9QLK9_9PEZI|nr:heterokaryon incompatibility protein [Colletotrichum tamarilloi]KAK1476755.1 heterokaryon incompatibility protein [Colletotrichum tamarilloi]
MSRWHERGCARPDVVVCDGLPCCRFCYGVASIEDLQFDTSLKIRKAPVIGNSSTYNLQWPACVDYVDSQPEIPPNASTSSSLGSNFSFGRMSGSERIQSLLKGPGGSFQSVQLNFNKARYEALSYTWADLSGDSIRRRPMFIGPYWDIIPITRNCENALRSVQLIGGGSRSIWVDSLCINQDDEEERNAQVALMPQIYAAAIGVLAYLGPAADDSDRALNAIFHSISHRNCGHSGEESEVCADCRMPIIKLLSRPYFRRLTVEEVSIGVAAYLTQRCGLGMAVLLFAGFVKSGKIKENEKSIFDNVVLDTGSLSLQLSSPCDIRINSRSGFLEVTAIRVCDLRGFFTEDGKFAKSFVRPIMNLDTGEISKNMRFRPFSTNDHTQLDEQKRRLIEDLRLTIGRENAKPMLRAQAEPFLMKLATYICRHQSDSKNSLWKTWKQFEAKLKPYLEDERGIQLLLRGITEADHITMATWQDGTSSHASVSKRFMLRSSGSLLTLLWSLLPKTRHHMNEAFGVEKMSLPYEEVLKGFQDWADTTNELLFAMAHSVEYKYEFVFGIRSSVSVQKAWLRAFKRFENRMMPQPSSIMGAMEAIVYVLKLFPHTEEEHEQLCSSTHVHQRLHSETNEIVRSYSARNCLWNWEAVGSNFEKRWKILERLSQDRWLASWRDGPIDMLVGLEQQMSIRYQMNSFGFNLTLPTNVTIQ